MLHRLNPSRCNFIRSSVASSLGREASKSGSLQGLNILDVGCGGGLLAESLARFGGNVTGIDFTEESIEVARRHAAIDPFLADKTRWVAMLNTLCGRQSSDHSVTIHFQAKNHRCVNLLGTVSGRDNVPFSEAVP